MEAHNMRPACYGGILVVLLLVASPILAADTLSKSEGEVKEAVEAHVKAYNERDIKSVMASMAPIPTLVHVGNGPKDRRVGVEQTRAQYEWAFKNRPITISVNKIIVGANGDVGWFTAYCDVKPGKGKGSIPTNWTGVLERRDGKWLFVLSHYSYPLTAPKAEVDLR